jgi:hypothetical protein
VSVTFRSRGWGKNSKKRKQWPEFAGSALYFDSGHRSRAETYVLA